MKISPLQEVPVILSLIILAVAAIATGYICSLAENALTTKTTPINHASYDISSKRMQNFLSFSHYCEYRGGNSTIETFDGVLIFHCDYDGCNGSFCGDK